MPRPELQLHFEPSLGMKLDVVLGGSAWRLDSFDGSCLASPYWQCSDLQHIQCTVLPERSELGPGQRCSTGTCGQRSMSQSGRPCESERDHFAGVACGGGGGVASEAVSGAVAAGVTPMAAAGSAKRRADKAASAAVAAAGKAATAATASTASEGVAAAGVASSSRAAGTAVEKPQSSSSDDDSSNSGGE